MVQPVPPPAIPRISATVFLKTVELGVELLDIMGNRFDAKDAFAFGIDLQGQLAAVQLEDRQIIHRSLDRDFPFGRTPAIFRAMLVTEDGLDGFQVERRAAAVDQGLKHLVHVRADLEDQVATVFDLVVGVLVTEAAALLLVVVEGEADTAVNPTLADLAQPPYSPMLGQGVCDLRQTCVWRRPMALSDGNRPRRWRAPAVGQSCLHSARR